MTQVVEQEQSRYDEWSETDKAELAQLMALNDGMPDDAPRALIALRLSVLTDETTNPVRNELDLRRLAVGKGYKVIGIAADLGVSALKNAPWERKELGHWLMERTPAFDAIFFWKLDRFVRHLNDFNDMVKWCDTYQKNLVSKVEELDLKTVTGRIIATVIAGMAQIEAENTRLRIEDLWAYTKTQETWAIGKPPFGYRIKKSPKNNTLVIEEWQAQSLMYCRDRLVAGDTVEDIAEGMVTFGLTEAKVSTTTIRRRLGSPAVMGLRVQENKIPGHSAWDQSELVYNNEGQPIRVGPPIFTPEEYAELREEIAKRKTQRAGRVPRGKSKFLGVLKCPDCDGNISLHTQMVATKKDGTNKKAYRYLVCRRRCFPGSGVPNPDAVYKKFANQILVILGPKEVLTREYSRGAENLEKVREIEAKIDYYQKGLEPGGMFKIERAKNNAMRALDALQDELDAIDPESTEDRWIYTSTGRTYGEHWSEGGDEAMAEDLLNSGVVCYVNYKKGEPVDLDIRIPRAIGKRMATKDNMFDGESRKVR